MYWVLITIPISQMKKQRLMEEMQPGGHLCGDHSLPMEGVWPHLDLGSCRHQGTAHQVWEESWGQVSNRLSGLVAGTHRAAVTGD